MLWEWVIIVLTGLVVGGSLLVFFEEITESMKRLTDSAGG